MWTGQFFVLRETVGLNRWLLNEPVGWSYYPQGGEGLLSHIDDSVGGRGGVGHAVTFLQLVNLFIIVELCPSLDDEAHFPP